MSTPWRRWLALLARTETGESLAAFRIAIGLCTLGSLGSVIASHLVEALWADPSYGGIHPLRSEPWPFVALGGRTPAAVWSVVSVTLLASAATAIGLGGRVAPFVALQGFLALLRCHPEAGGAYDQLLSNALWLLVLSRSTATWSADCRLWRGAWSSPDPVSAWPRYLVVFQLVVMYASSAAHKLSVFWTPVGEFSALYYVLQQPSWQRFDMGWVAHVYPATQLATAAVWIFELSAPLLLGVLYYHATAEHSGRLRSWSNRHGLRSCFAIAGAGMHVAIFALMQVGTFSWVVLSFYLCLWSPRELAGAARGVLSRTGDSKPRPPRASSHRHAPRATPPPPGTAA